jgi:5-methylcytosine-specific restriction protein B
MPGPDGYRVSSLRSSEPVRHMVVLGPNPAPAVPAQTAASAVGGLLPDEHELYQQVLAALEDQFGGVILVGPPGTSKSWYAYQIALKLTGGDPERVRKIQFHPSYQYEDFVEGYVPANGTFKAVPKHLLIWSDKANESLRNDTPPKPYVLIIDELSRSDPARVFGEALTYVEKSKRGEDFYIASGEKVSLAKNLIILATMNLFDRGVDDVDAAFDRRMAVIEMPPKVDLVRQFLSEAGMEAELLEKVVGFFNWAQSQPDERVHIGHTYFIGLRTRGDLERRWNLQVRHFFKKAYGLDTRGFASVQAAWNKLLAEETESGAEIGPVS